MYTFSASGYLLLFTKLIVSMHKRQRLFLNLRGNSKNVLFPIQLNYKS